MGSIEHSHCLRRAHYQLGDIRRTWRVLRLGGTKVGLSVQTRAGDSECYSPGTGAILSETALPGTKGFTGNLRLGGSLTEAQDLEKTGKGISVEKRGEGEQPARLQGRSPGRLAGPLTETPRRLETAPV